MISANPPPENGEEQQAFSALDDYLNELLAGRVPDQRKILARFPHLAETLDCIDGLNRLVRAEGINNPENAVTLAPAEAPTVASDASHAATLAIDRSAAGTTFGRYELLSLLGCGGMGIVYKAKESGLDRVVAIKMILASRLASEQQVRRFLAESRIAARLQHPHILQVYEAGEVLGQPYFSMQYVDGSSLETLVAKGPMPPIEAAQCVLGIAQAVAFLHDNGIIHRDLKPANILLNVQRWPFVTDFGLAKLADSGQDVTSTGVIVGTPSYMAPEQAAGLKAEIGKQSDVYSLGAILYATLTGRPPFRESTPLDTLVQVLEGEPELPRLTNPNVPRDLELICMTAMAKSLTERYPSASALAADLERHLRGEPVQARSYNTKQRLVRWARQETGLVVRLAALLASAIIANIAYELMHHVTLLYHAGILSMLGLWAGTAIICQAFIRRGRKPDYARRLWLACDTCMLTATLIVLGAFSTPLSLGYAVIVVGSGLWFRASLVWYATGLTLMGYAALCVIGFFSGALGNMVHYHAIFLAVLALLGWVVAVQAQRVRALSRYYEHRPL